MESNNRDNRIQIERNDITMLTLRVGAAAQKQEVGHSSWQQYESKAASEFTALAAATAVGSARQHWSIGTRADLAIAAAKAVNSDTA